MIEFMKIIVGIALWLTLAFVSTCGIVNAQSPRHAIVFKDGTIAGTIVQNPYEYGYQSVKILKDILEKKEVKDFIDIPPRKVTKENVDEYWADLKAKKAG